MRGPMNCRITSSTTGSTGLIKICGNLFLNHRFRFTDACSDLLRNPDIKNIEVHLDELTQIDSSGLGMFLMLREQALNAGKSLLLRSPVGLVAESLHTANFRHIFAIEEAQENET